MRHRQPHAPTDTHTVHSHLLPSLWTEEEGNVCALPLCGEKLSSHIPLMGDWEIHTCVIGLTKSYTANEREKEKEKPGRDRVKGWLK